MKISICGADFVAFFKVIPYTLKNLSLNFRIVLDKNDTYYRCRFRNLVTPIYYAREINYFNATSI